MFPLRFCGAGSILQGLVTVDVAPAWGGVGCVGCRLVPSGPSAVSAGRVGPMAVSRKARVYVASSQAVPPSRASSNAVRRTNPTRV